MTRTTIVILALATLGVATQADAQDRDNRPERWTRQEVARAQGVPPGQLPPPDRCRVWFDNRPNGRQPSPIDCRQAEALAARDHNARVIYGEDAYAYRHGSYNRDLGYPGTWGREGDNNRGVSRPGRNRDPRISGGVYDPRYGNARYAAPAFQRGYRDGLEKGREDANDNDRYDPNRHSWYRSATRGYEDEYGPRANYQARYREGFEAGYSESYRTFDRR